MSKEQWTVVGLLIVLASLEIIRSGAVQGFFSGFFGQFGVKSGGPNSEVYVNNAPASTSATPTFRGMQAGTKQTRGSQ